MSEGWNFGNVDKALRLLERIATALERAHPKPPIRMLDQTDYGVRCQDCAVAILGVSTLAGAMRCSACHLKAHDGIPP